MQLLERKNVFVSGGSRGIGAAIVEAFVQQGARVGFSYRHNADAAQRLLEKMTAAGGVCKAYRCDAAHEEDVQRTLAAFHSDFGGLDVLVNNAGIIRDQLAATMPLADWNEVMAVNLTAAFLHVREALQWMIPARSGAIINMGSVSGERGMAGQANYAAAKAGLIGFTRSIAREVGSRNIRCNAIAPGLIETDMTRERRTALGERINANIALKRVGQASEIAGVAVFLASDMSSYVTGQVINACGGLTF